MPAGEIGDQGAMVALIELGPIGVAQGVEHGERLVGLSGRLLHPGPRQDRGEIGDRPLARRGEMLVGFLVFALLEGVAAEQELGDAVVRLAFDQIARKLDGAIPVSGRRLEQEGLLQDQLVVGVFGERPRIEIGRGGGVVVAARYPARQVIAEQVARIGMIGVDNLGIGCGRGDDGESKQQPPRPCAERSIFISWHVRSA